MLQHDGNGTNLNIPPKKYRSRKLPNLAKRFELFFGAFIDKDGKRVIEPDIIQLKPLKTTTD